MWILEVSGHFPFSNERTAFHRGDERRTFLFCDQYTQGWDHSFQVPRADFDQTLLTEVEARGAAVFHEHTVVDVEVGESPVVVVQSPDGGRQRIDARFVIDASGYGRVLPRLLDMDRPSHLPVRHSLFTWVESDRREEGPAGGRTWVCVHPDGAWIWAIPFADGRTSVGVVAEPSFFEAYPSDPAARLRAILQSEPNAKRRLGDAAFAFDPVLIPGYSIAVEALHGPGFCLVGNTMEFLDPVFSSGVTLALESAVHAAGLVGRQLSGESVDWPVEYDAHIASGVEAFKAYVDAWYAETLQTLMFAEGRHDEVQRQITSVLAGYVWDDTNPLVTQAERRLRALASSVRAGMHNREVRS